MEWTAAEIQNAIFLLVGLIVVIVISVPLLRLMRGMENDLNRRDPSDGERDED